jgi:hypothetical protein
MAEGSVTTTPFAKGFLRVISGTKTIEDFVQGMVSGAVVEALQKVCNEYGLDVNEVREKYEQTIVGKHASISGEGSVPKFCEGKTATGKQCGRSATNGKFCKTHAPKVDDDAKRVQGVLEEYERSLAKMPKRPALYMGSQPILTQLDEGGSYY